MAEISGYTTDITTSDVRERIEALEDQAYELVRDRNGEIMLTSDDEDDCREYLDSEDLNPERFTIRREALDEEDQSELDSLRDLLERADSQWGEPWEMRLESSLDEDWAKDEAREALGNRYADFDEWPLDQVDWDDAARTRRAQLYTSTLIFDDETYWGK